MPDELPPITHIYAGNPLDRGDQQRRDEGWLHDRAQDPTSKFLPLWENTVLISSEPEHDLGWIGLDDVQRLGIEVEGIFLGLREGARPLHRRHHPQQGGLGGLRADDAYSFEDTRGVTDLISLADSGIVAQARAQVNWHNRHGYCAVCGHPTEMRRGGHMRLCPTCNTQHFPRTDPVVITVVADGDRCLLGQSRGRLQAMNRYSALAGFMDQGESIEEAVAREIMEEAGIRVEERPLSLVAAVAVPLDPDDRLPRRRRHHRHQHGRGRDVRRPLVHPRRRPQRPRRHQREPRAAGAHRNCAPPHQGVGGGGGVGGVRNQWFGDKNDYLKYSVIRHFMSDGHLGVAVNWMLTPDTGIPDPVGPTTCTIPNVA